MPRDVHLQGVEKTILSKMLVEGSNRRTYAVDRHAGVVRPRPSLAAEARVSLDTSVFHLVTMPKHLCFLRFNSYVQAVAGVAADGRQAVKRCISEAQQYKR